MKNLLLLFIFLIGVSMVYAQDVPFSMYHDTPSQSTPAWIATDNQLSINYHRRVQWKGVHSRWRTNALSLKYPIVTLKDNKPIRWGAIGLSYLKDVTDLQKASTLSMTLAFNLKIKENLYLSMATQSRFYTQKINADLITSYDANYQPIIQPNDLSKQSYMTFGGSLLLYQDEGFPSYEKKFFVGASLFHLNQPNVSYLDHPDNTLALRSIFVGGYRIFRSENISIVPNIKWTELPSTRQVNVGYYYNYHFSEGSGALFRHGTIGLGMWYSVDNAVITSIEFDSPTFKAGFSYDFGASDLSKNNGYAGSSAFSFSIKKTIGKPKEVKVDFDDIHDSDDIDEIEEID